MYLHSDIIRLLGVVYIYGLLRIFAHRECQDSLLLPTFWRQLAEIATGRRALPVCRFSPLLRHRGVASVDGGGAAVAPFNPSYLGRLTGL